ncbi:restriction endonuclease [Psittacicella hinzii]|uniref:Restriction endonuclease n=1 Tax=Psittacicella hinzii TaxID=2028575 RepID=A0A3A1Y2Q2_9GAMM|nr:restriction endonuclease [Psittacicella hinzii]RIY31845.1 restriction endonuclease [Psittacicella hinzii]
MNVYQEFFNQYDFDIRKSRDARWIDQKCTYDVVSIIADCIVEYLENSPNKEFTVSDIWHSEYARENVISIFSKPDPSLKATNEYDKYFGQPIKLLGYSHVLNVRKVNNRYFYSINNQEILEKIALRPTNALNFLYEYICKVLTDSELMPIFNNFFEVQTKESYQEVVNKFVAFTIENTNINKRTECGRIFTKVINPLAFKLQKLGTKKGRISKLPITLSDLQYNRFNWRDELSGKSKSITRAEHEQTTSQQQIKALADYTINKAKNAVRKFNAKYNDSNPEVKQKSELVKATQVHHIFAQADYPSIADFLENLIMLTPNQHFTMAHPNNNNTQYIDRDFQYICLIAKATTIYQSLTSPSTEKFYNFDNYKIVLNTGLETEEFSEVAHLDFANLINKIDSFYCSPENNKYKSLIKDNKPKLD